MMMPDQLALAAWLTTYLLHSTVLLGGVWALTRWRRHLHPEFEEWLWRGALLIPLVTTVLQTTAQVTPLGGPIVVAAEPGAVLSAPQTDASADLATIGSHSDPGVTGNLDAEHNLGVQPHLSGLDAPEIQESVPQERRGEAAPTSPPPESASRSRSLAKAWSGGGLAALMAAMMCIGLWTLLEWLRLCRLARGRIRIHDGPLIDELGELVRASGMRRRVALSRSAALRTPVAVGLLRPQIIVPDAALKRLDPAEQRSLLAHELAHHMRWDPLWLAGANFISMLAFFQPLNVLASRRLRDLAEVNCDAWAIRQLGERIPLARCLAEVASWVVGGVGDRTWRRVPCMARSASGLRQRVARLLNETNRPLPPAHRRGAVLTAVIVMLAAALVIPGVVAKRASTPDTGARNDEVGSWSHVDPVAELQDDIAALEQRIAALSADGRIEDEQMTQLIDQLQHRVRELHARCEPLRVRWREQQLHTGEEPLSDLRPPQASARGGATERSEQP